MQAYQGAPLPEFESAPGWLAVSRGVALFLGSYLLIHLASDLKFGVDSASHWWLQLAPLSAQQANGFLATCGAMLLVFAFKPSLPGPIRIVSTLVLLALAGGLGYTAWLYFQSLKAGEFTSSFPVPFSLQILAMLVVVLVGIWKNCNPSLDKGRDFLLGLFAVALCLITFPIAQMFCYGHIDHRQMANVITVFGCQVDADGNPSAALRNRMLTGIELYHAGQAPALLLSGGPGDGEYHETTAMRRLALEGGVPESALIIDEQGWNTSDTVNNVQQFFQQQMPDGGAGGPAPRMLAVSDFYHLPRIRLAAERSGLECYTVPTTDPTAPDKQALSLGREVAAYWWYEVKPFVPAGSRE